MPHDTHDDIGGPAELERRRSPEDGESKKIFKFGKKQFLSVTGQSLCSLVRVHVIKPRTRQRDKLEAEENLATFWARESTLDRNLPI